MADAMAVAGSNSDEIWEWFVALTIVLHRLAGSVGDSFFRAIPQLWPAASVGMFEKASSNRQ